MLVHYERWEWITPAGETAYYEYHIFEVPPPEMYLLELRTNNVTGDSICLEKIFPYKHLRTLAACKGFIKEGTGYLKDDYHFQLVSDSLPEPEQLELFTD